MKTPLSSRSLWTIVAAAGLACSQLALAAGLDWRISEFAAIDGDTLVVDVPADAPSGMYGATATLDLAPYEGRSLAASVEAESGPLSTAAKPIHGLKVMFHFANPLAELDCWPEARRPATPFARRKLEVSDTLSGGSRSPTGTLFLGLQGVTGRIVFDLSTLEIRVGEPYWPVTNQNLRCEYAGPLAETAIHRGDITPRRGVMSPARDCTEDDFRTLADWGATLIRYQMVDGPEPAADEATEAYLVRYRAWLDGRLDHLDHDVLPWAVRYGMEVVVDLHSPPGGRVEAREFRMFREKAYADEFVALWRRIAVRFLGRAGIYGYDLCNEPVQHGEALPECDYWNLQRRAAEAIREIDPETPVIVEANNWDVPSNFSALSPLALTNVIYEVHVYNPIQYTHQGVFRPVDEPIPYPCADKGWDKDYLRRILIPVRAFEKRHGAKIYVGEFSAATWAPGADEYLRDCTDLFSEFGWVWTYHAFRESPCWSIEQEGPDGRHLVPSADNPRKRALLDGFSRSSSR
jgi:hypothetical protein